MRQLEGKRIVLTGAAGGIGSLVAERLQRAGARVLGVDRRPCLAAGEALAADLSTEAGLDALCAELRGRHVDILINAAGLQYFGPFEAQDPVALWRTYAVNLIAPAMLTRAVIPAMRARGSGHIVNIGSVMGSINYPYFAAYSSSKAGLRGLNEALRRELAGTGIDVTHIAPRAVNTPLNTDNINHFFDRTGMKADDPESVAAAIVTAVARRRKLVSIGIAERFYARVNGLFPGVIDAGLAGQARTAHQLFASLNQEGPE